MSRRSFGGAQVRLLRADRGLSPEQLGWATGVSGPTVRRIERGAIPTARVQYAIASYFDMRPSQLWPVDQRAPRRTVAA